MPAPTSQFTFTPEDAQLLVTLILGLTAAVVYDYLPRRLPELKGKTSTRVVAGGILAGAIFSQLCWTLEALADGRPSLAWFAQTPPGAAARDFLQAHPNIVPLAGYGCHSASLAVTAAAAWAMTIVMPNLLDSNRATERRILRSAVPILAFCFAVASAVVGTAILNNDPALDLRAEQTAAAHLYRFFMVGSPIGYLAIMAAYLWEAHKRQSGGPTMARRSRFLAFAILGILLEQAQVLSFPIAAHLAPGSALAHSAPALTRIVEIPIFAAICAFSIAAFAVRYRESKPQRLKRYVTQFRALALELAAARDGRTRGSNLLTSDWYAFVTVLHDTLTNLGLSSQDRRRALDAHELVGLLCTGELDRAKTWRLTRLYTILAHGRYGQATQRHARRHTLIPTLHFALQLTSQRPISLIHRRPLWQQAVAVASAEHALLSERHRSAILHSLSDGADPRVLRAYAHARLELDAV